MWLVLTAFSIVFRAIYGVTTKVLSNKLQGTAYTQAFLLTMAGAGLSLLTFPFFGFEGFSFSNVNYLVVALVIFGQGLGNIVYFAAIKYLTNGTAQIAFSSILVFNTILAVLFMNLQLSALNMVGIVLLGLAILSVITGKIDFNAKGVALMVLSAFLFSIFQLASVELSQQVGVITYLLIAYLGSAIIVFAVKGKIIIQDIKKFKNSKIAFGLPLMAAVPSIAYFICAYFAYRIAEEPTKVAILLTAQVVLTVFLSYLFLGEKNHMWRKVGAALLVVIAAALIKG